MHSLVAGRYVARGLGMALVLAMGCQGGSRSRGPLPIPMSDAAVEGDGATVTADARVDASPTCTPGPEDNLRACTDGCDNDGDPFVDCDDRDCCAVRSDCPASTWCGSHVPAEDSGTPECVTGPENTAAACSDGCDNDGDPFVDCEDYDCCGVVSCPVSSACGMVEWGADFVSTRAPDCVGTGSVFYTFSATRYEMVTVAFSTSTGYQVFGYTRGDITRGPFPLMGMTDERQVRVADLGSGLQMALSRWGGSAWSSSEGGSASYSDSSTVNLASDAEDRYASHACVGYVEGFATAPVLGGVDYMHFEFVAPVLGLAFPGI